MQILDMTKVNLCQFIIDLVGKLQIKTRKDEDDQNHCTKEMKEALQCNGLIFLPEDRYLHLNDVV